MAKDLNICPRCKEHPKQKHFNSEWCKPCAWQLRHRPPHRLTTEQQRKVRRLAGVVAREKLPKEIGASLSSIWRFCRDTGISLATRYYPDSVREAVCAYYLKHGKRKTQKKFPSVSVRSIVERYNNLGKRQIRWKPEEVMDLARFAGIVSMTAQANYFNRPKANEGSISSAWMKKFHQGGGQIHGLHKHVAYKVVRGGRMEWQGRRNGARVVIPRIKPVQTEWWRPNKGTQKRFRREIYLWVDIEKHLRPDLPPEFKRAIRAMAKFQRWLFGVKDVKKKILKTKKDMEAQYGKKHRGRRKEYREATAI